MVTAGATRAEPGRYVLEHSASGHPRDNPARAAASPSRWPICRADTTSLGGRRWGGDGVIMWPVR